MSKMKILGLVVEKIKDVGIHLFLWTFWINKGIYLGGDAYYLGKYTPSLEVVFPICGIGILLVYVTTYFKIKKTSISKQKALWILVFLSISTLISQFSLNPKTSIYYLIIWSVGFFVCNNPTVFRLNSSVKQFSLFGSLILGTILSFYVDFIHPAILGLGIVWLFLFLHIEKKISHRYLISYILGGLLYILGLPILLVVMTVFWLTSNSWLGVRNKMTSQVKWLTGLGLSLLLSIIAILQADFSFSLGILKSLSSLTGLLFGIGEGQYMKLFADPSAISLDPSQWTYPFSGLIITMIEKGVLGVLLLLVWIARGSNMKIFKALVLIGIAFSPMFLILENGILLLSAILFSQEQKNSTKEKERTSI